MILLLLTKNCCDNEFLSIFYTLKFYYTSSISGKYYEFLRGLIAVGNGIS